jgi:hypothetical protein
MHTKFWWGSLLKRFTWMTKKQTEVKTYRENQRWMGVTENCVQWWTNTGNNRVEWEWLRTVSNGKQALVTLEWNESG